MLDTFPRNPSPTTYTTSAVIHTKDGTHMVESLDPTFSPSHPLLQGKDLNVPLDQTDDILFWLLHKIRETAGFSHALVGELCGADWNQIQTLLVDTNQGRGENFKYELHGTPCKEVLDSSCIAYTSDVWKLFPEDHLLEDMGIQSYIGLPIYDDVGRPLGIVVLLKQSNIDLRSAQSALELLAGTNSFFKKSLEERRRQRDFEDILQSITGNSSNSLDSLLQSLSKRLMTRGVLLATPTSDGALTLRNLFLGSLPLQANVEIYFSEVLKQKVLEQKGPFLISLQEDRDFSFGENADEALQNTLRNFLQHSILIPVLTDNGELLGFTVLFNSSPLNPRIVDLPLLQLIRNRLSVLLREEEAERTRHQAEQRVQQMKQLESLGILAAGIAHDFNNILVGVLGNADFLLELLDTSESNDVNESVKDIKEAAFSAHNLCKQLMLYAGRTKMERTTFHLSSVLGELSRLAKSTLNVPCSYSEDGSCTELSVSGDETQIRQVIMNLLTNARDALTGDGKVELTLSTVSLEKSDHAVFSGVIPAGNYAVISVKDNGCGIEEEKLTRIFEPFYTTKGTGHGLGLAGILGLIESHKGWLDVNTKPGVGTEFLVYLPSKQPGESSSSEQLDARTETPPLEKRTLLVVDDDPRVRRLLSRFASRAGYETLFAQNGEEALEVYGRNKDNIDGVLLDMNMPVMNGEQCYAGLLEMDPEIKVVVSSGNLVNNMNLPQLPKPYTFHSFQTELSLLLEA